MPVTSMPARLARILGENPELAFEFYCTASEVVDDFEDYGPVLQADEAGAYSKDAAISRLKAARAGLIELLQDDQPHSAGSGRTPDDPSPR